MNGTCASAYVRTRPRNNASRQSRDALRANVTGTLNAGLPSELPRKRQLAGKASLTERQKKALQAIMDAHMRDHDAAKTPATSGDARRPPAPDPLRAVAIALDGAIAAIHTGFATSEGAGDKNQVVLRQLHALFFAEAMALSRMIFAASERDRRQAAKPIRDLYRTALAVLSPEAVAGIPIPMDRNVHPLEAVESRHPMRAYADWKGLRGEPPRIRDGDVDKAGRHPRRLGARAMEMPGGCAVAVVATWHEFV